MNKRNFITGWIVLAFFLFFYYHSLKLTSGADYWPKLLCIIGAALSLMSVIISGLKCMAEKTAMSVFPLNKDQIKRGLTLMLVMILWIAAITRLGYLISSILATTALMLIFEPLRSKGHIIRNLTVALIFSVTMFGLFSILGVHFPSGLLI